MFVIFIGKKKIKSEESDPSKNKNWKKKKKENLKNPKKNQLIKRKQIKKKSKNERERVHRWGQGSWQS